jgi:hypothetical protein
VRAVEHAKGMPAGPSFQHADAPILDTRNDHAVELELPIHQTGRTPLLSLDAETPDGRDRGTASHARRVARRPTGGRLQDVCRPLGGRIDRLPSSAERFQASFGVSVAGMQIRMTGPDRNAESSPNVFPWRFLVDLRRASSARSSAARRMCSKHTVGRVAGTPRSCLNAPLSPSHEQVHLPRIAQFCVRSRAPPRPGLRNARTAVAVMPSPVP